MSTCNHWPVHSRSRSIAVALPGSILSVEPNLIMKTFKTGVIARALSVFRVNDVFIYKDPDTTNEDQRILYLILKYLEIPPYLRKRLIPIKKELRWVGILPPLRIPLHDVPEKVNVGDVIEGVVTKDCRVYLGEILGTWKLEKDECNNLKIGNRITVFITNKERRKVKMFRGNIYKGYKIRLSGSINELVRELRKRGYYLLGTSRKGECKDLRELSNTLRNIYSNKRLAFIFGGPKRGLFDMIDSTEMFDEVINMIPFQGTKTVRTEEALWVTLSIMNYITSDCSLHLEL